MSIDPELLAAEFAADDDVLRSLKGSGDVPSVSRAVDVSFRGEINSLEMLASSLQNEGFTVIDRTRSDDDTPWIFLERYQTTERPTIHELTQYCLEKAQLFGVTYDGWGCVASNEHGAISNENPASD